MDTRGAIGLAQRYDGVDDVIGLTAAESASLNFATPALTLEFWIQPDPSRPDYNDPITLGGYNDGYRIGIARTVGTAE